MRHALDVEGTRLLIAVNAGGTQRWDTAGVPKEKDNILGALLSKHDGWTVEESDQQKFSNHSLIKGWTGNRFSGKNQLIRLS